MARKEFLNYVWDKCVSPQLGYSFSIPHDIGYSLIGWQEVNLFERFNPLFWSCACLNVNSGDLGDDNPSDYEELSEQDNSIDQDEEEEVEEKKKNRVAPNYKKIAKAICDAQLSGVNISLPDINTSVAEFYPDVENNAILYNLSAINSVGDDLYDRIIANRPYKTMNEFIEKVNPTVGEMFGLIKSGCFNRLLKKETDVIAYYYVNKLADQNIPLKEKITATDIKKIIKLGFIAPGLELETRIFKFKTYIDKFQLDSTVKTRYLLTEESCIKFFEMFFKQALNASKDEYIYLPDNKIAVKSSTFKKVYDKKIERLTNYYNSPEGLKNYREKLQEIYKQELIDKYCSGPVSKWQFDTMYFYHDGHELKNMNDSLYKTRNFNELPEITEDKTDLCSIAGTVIGTNNNKHMISLLTKYGVVDVKLYAEYYNRFNQKISEIDPETKKKTVIEDSWFKRGNKILVYGQRKENLFSGRIYREGNYSRVVGLIEGVNNDGSLELRFTRKKKV